MADTVITPANVIPGSGAQIVNGTSGEALAIGVPVFLNGSNQYQACDADNVARNTAFAGITVSQAAAAGQPVAVQTGGVLAFGAVLTNGSFYYVSSNQGNFGTLAGTGITTNNMVIQIGYAVGTANMTIKPVYTGVTL